MKTIVQIPTRLSKYIFEDSATVSITEDRIVTENFIISDLNSNNSLLIDVSNAPYDWQADKYFYINNQWVLNEEWRPHVRETEEEAAKRILKSLGITN